MLRISLTNLNMTKQVLLDDVAGNARRVEYGLYSFMGIGNRDILPELVNLLNQRGNETIALVYLNCGEPTLEKAAQDWAIAISPIEAAALGK